MTVYIGVDLHVRTQTVCWCDTADGEIHEQELDHEKDDVRGFYQQFAAPAVIGVEVELMNASNGILIWSDTLIASRAALSGSEPNMAQEIVSRVRNALAAKQ